MQNPQNAPARNILFSTLGGLAGALGIIAYAGAAHSDGSHLGTIAPLLLAHAPALLVLSILVPSSRIATIGGALLIAGLTLFCGDLYLRDVTGNRLFPFAAPTGGTLMIIGWLGVGISGWFSRTR